MSGGRWRIVVLSTVPPVVERLVPFLAELGHEPVAVVGARYEGAEGDARPPALRPEHLHRSLPVEVALAFPATKHQVAPLFRAFEPDLVLCWGYPWKLPPEALAVPRLGCVNQHPAALPRHRGPVPLAWALREGDSHFGLTWHRMEAELDTGPILAQGRVAIRDDDRTIEDVGPRMLETALELLTRALERIAAADEGDPQPREGASWAGHFGEDYATVDWSQPARAIHNQVRAWSFTFGLSSLVAPVAELDGQRVRLVRTSLSEREDAVARVECGDGQPLWILEAEPVA